VNLHAVCSKSTVNLQWMYNQSKVSPQSVSSESTVNLRISSAPISSLPIHHCLFITATHHCYSSLLLITATHHCYSSLITATHLLLIITATHSSLLLRVHPFADMWGGHAVWSAECCEELGGPDDGCSPTTRGQWSYRTWWRKDDSNHVEYFKGHWISDSCDTGIQTQ
jgi:hypothetical protein